MACKQLNPSAESVMPIDAFHHYRSVRRCAAAVSRQMVVTIALVLIIAGSIAFNWSMIFGGPATGRAVVEMGFQCMDCDHQFTMLNTDFQGRRIDNDYLARHPASTVDMVDCPKCGKQHAATEQLKCPSCAKFFLPARVNVRAAAQEGKTVDLVCPHCGTDMNEWHRQHHPK